MGVVEQSHEMVELYISALEQSYGTFAINQTTLTVPPSEYDRERERASAGCVEIYIKVTNDEADVLHIEDGDERVVPSTRTEGVPLETVATDIVEDETGVACQIEEIEQATILGIRDSESDRETVYRLAIVFSARPTSQAGTGPPSTAEKAVWQRVAAVPEVIAP